MTPEEVLAACEEHAVAAENNLNSAERTPGGENYRTSAALLSIAHSIASLELMLRASFKEDFVDDRG